MCEKVCFPSETSARRAVKRARRSKKHHRRECRTYYCPHCHAWHLSSKPKDQAGPRRHVKYKRDRVAMLPGAFEID